MSKKAEVIFDQEVFTIFDSKSDDWKVPQVKRNRSLVERELLTFFADPTKRQTSELWTNAEDFQLFSVGRWSTETGMLDSWPPKHCVNILELKQMVLSEERKADKAAAGNRASRRAQ